MVHFGYICIQELFDNFKAMFLAKGNVNVREEQLVVCL
jgi:hypothetical protein